jgi:PAS domain S-box-containing protein
MPKLRRLIVYSFSVLTVVILFNIVGYYIINYKTDQFRLADDGGKIASNQQVFIQRISRNITSLSVHRDFSAEQHAEQQNMLKETLTRLNQEQQAITNIVQQPILSSCKGITTVRKYYSEASLYYNNIFFIAQKLLTDSSNKYLSDSAYQNRLKANEAGYLKSMEGITTGLEEIERYLGRDIDILNKAIIISLIFTLVFLGLLVVAPVFKQSVRNYNHLQISLEEIKKSETLLRTVIDSTPDQIFVTDNAGRFIMVNEAMAVDTGLVQKDFINKTPTELGFDARVLMDDGTEMHLFKNGNSLALEEEYLNLQEAELVFNNQNKYISLIKTPLKDHEQNTWGFLYFIHDVTAKITAKKRIEDSERKYRYLFEVNPMPMWIYDSETYRFLEVNEMAISHYGYSKEEFSEMTIYDIRPKSEKEKLDQLLSRGKSESASKGFWTHVKKNGEKIFVEIISHDIDYNGRKATLILSKDVTRNIKLQNELVDEKIARQREIARASLTVQEKERNEIGKELHDNVNQILTSAKLHLDYMAQSEADKEKHRAMSLNLVTNAIQEIRRLSKSLVPPSLGDVGLISSIQDLVEDINECQSLIVDFESCELDEELYDPGLKLTVLRIIQEQTTNILKYADASYVHVEISRSKDHLILKISDNGKGFDPSKTRKGIGITNIINRADIYHGKVEIDSKPGNGCTLKVDFTLDPKSDPDQQAVKINRKR